MPSMRKASLALTLALALMAPAHGQQLEDGTPIRADDLRRLDALDASAGSALRQALAAGDPADLTLLVEVMAGDSLPPDQAQAALPGAWSCQMIKLGGMLPLVVYPPFRCIATATSFEKLTGSQRTIGTLHEHGRMLVYLGTGFVAGDTPPPYAQLPTEADPQASPQRMPEIGVVEMTGPDRGRILFPAPYLKSRMNLLVLHR